MQQGQPPVAVGTEADPGLAVERRAVHDPQQQERAEQAADELGDPVAQHVDDRDALGQVRAQRHGRVDVTARERPDDRHQAEQDQAERQAGQQDAGRRG